MQYTVNSRPPISIHICPSRPPYTQKKISVKFNGKSVLLWVICEKNTQNTHKKDRFADELLPWQGRLSTDACSQWLASYQSPGHRSMKDVSVVTVNMITMHYALGTTTTNSRRRIMYWKINIGCESVIVSSLNSQIGGRPTGLDGRDALYVHARGSQSLFSLPITASLLKFWPRPRSASTIIAWLLYTTIIGKLKSRSVTRH